MKEDWSVKDGSAIARGKAIKLVCKFMSTTKHTLLDIGSGNGLFIENLPPHFFPDASDTSNFLSEAARRRVGSFIATDLNNPWPFSDCSYDAITAWNMLEHLENPFHFAREAARVVKSGGFVFVSVPNVFEIRNRLHFFWSGEFVRYHPKNSHITLFTKTTLRKIFEQFNLEEQGFAGFDFPFPPKWLWRALLKRWLKNTQLLGQTLYMVLKKP